MEQVTRTDRIVSYPELASNPLSNGAGLGAKKFSNEIEVQFEAANKH